MPPNSMKQMYAYGLLHIYIEAAKATLTFGARFVHVTMTFKIGTWFFCRTCHLDVPNTNLSQIILTSFHTWGNYTAQTQMFSYQDFFPCKRITVWTLKILHINICDSFLPHMLTGARFLCNKHYLDMPNSFAKFYVQYRVMTWQKLVAH